MLQLKKFLLSFERLNYMEQVKPLSKYQFPHEQGVLLSDETIDVVVRQLNKGINDVYDYLQINDEDRNLGFVSSNDFDRIGYAQQAKAINVPVKYLNSLARIASLEAGKVSLDSLCPSLLEKPIDYFQFLVNAGREETIHHFQHLGHPAFHAVIPDPHEYVQAGEMEKFLCDLEVEARRTVDLIAERSGEAPIWRRIDAYLQKKYPHTYNKPLGVSIA